MAASSHSIVAEFDYRPHPWKTTGLLFLAVSGAALMTYYACTLDQPIRVKGFQLTAQQGRLLFGSFAVLSPLGFIPLACCVYVAFVKNRRVALTSDSILLPRPTRMGLSCDEIAIDLASIRSATIVDFIGSTKLLRLDHLDGVVSIPSNMFARRGQFDQMARLVQNAVSLARNAQTRAEPTAE